MELTLNLESKQLLRLSQARGATLEVLDGRVWITETGREGDALVSRGMLYDVAGDGLVVVGSEAGATRIALRPRLWQRLGRIIGEIIEMLRARWTIAELEQLSDRSLRDIGLRRDQIEAAVRRPGRY